jgi:iron(III) transport system permease protein
MFDYYLTAPVQILWGINDMAVSPRPYAAVVVMLLVSVGLFAVSKLYLGRSPQAVVTRVVSLRTPIPLRGWSGFAACCPFVLIIGLALLPHVGVVIASLSGVGEWYRAVLPRTWTFAHYADAARNPLVIGSIQNSLIYAGAATLLDLALGCVIAYLVVRVKPRGAALLDALAMLPLAVPGLVMAFGYVAMTLHAPFPQLTSFFEARGWERAAAFCRVTGRTPDPTLFLIVAYSVRRLPFILRSASAGLQQIPRELEEAAKNLGAGSWTTFRRVVVPLMAPSLIAGAMLTFSFAVLEVSDSLILAQSEGHFPITKAIYTLFRRLGDGPYVAGALGVWGMALLAVAVLGAAFLLGKRVGSLFRA